MLSQPRTFRHPGPSAYPRVQAAEVGKTRELRVEIPSGSNAGAVLRHVIDQYGLHSGCGRILHGSACRLQYHVVVKADAGDRPYTYGAPLLDAGEATALHGTFTIGRDAAGATALHCHAAFLGSDRLLHGGHVILDRLIVGTTPLLVRMTAFQRGGFEHFTDNETLFTLFGPKVEEARS